MQLMDFHEKQMEDREHIREYKTEKTKKKGIRKPQKYLHRKIFPILYFSLTRYIYERIQIYILKNLINNSNL